MPSAKKAQGTIDPTQQTDHTASDPAPENGGEQSLFDETEAAGDPTEDLAAPSDTSDGGDQEDAVDAEEGSPSDDQAPSSDAPAEVRLGQVTGLLHRMPLGDVLGYAEQFAEKIEAMTFSAKVQSRLPRMRVSEGRCAPIYFTATDGGEPDHLLAGDDALSAAKAIPLETVFVVLVQPGDAGAVHAYLNGQANAGSVSTEDDDLVWRSQGYHAG